MQRSAWVFAQSPKIGIQACLARFDGSARQRILGRELPGRAQDASTLCLNPPHQVQPFQDVRPTPEPDKIDINHLSINGLRPNRQGASTRQERLA